MIALEHYEEKDLPLFQGNNHSKWEISFKRITDAESAELPAVLKSNYSHLWSEILSIDEVNEAEINNQNFRVRVQTGSGEHMYLLRRVGKHHTTESIKAQLAIAEKLAKCGCLVPRVLQAESGAQVVEHQGNRYVLSDFISHNHYRGTFKELTDVAYHVGRFDRELAASSEAQHMSAVLSLTEKELKAREYSLEIWEDIFKRIEERIQRGEDIEYGKKVLARKDQIVRAVRKAEYPKLPAEKQVMHWDLHPHNILADGNALVAILDLDSLRTVEKMRAVSFAIHRLVRQCAVESGAETNKRAVRDYARAFIEAYRRENELTEEEIQLIPAFIRDESLRRLTSVLKQYAYEGHSPWKAEFEKQLAGVHEASYFENL